GDYAGAQQMYERALAIFEQHLGEEHPNVGTLVNNQGSVLKAMGDYAGAQQMYERALAIFEKALPPDHPTIQTIKGNLESLDQ
ncbi:MAG: tetratricopeptide repeat protein, partial [Chloroflexi bacterium]|nr:tetratricopeptide repeat protein [Chloroflexota bacterium]